MTPNPEYMKTMIKAQHEAFNEEYFKTLNYTDYLSRQDKYFRTAKEIASLLESLSIIDKDSSIFDYGCAVGFLLQGFKQLGYWNIHGYDVSEWAVIQAKNKGLNILNYPCSYKSHFSVMFALDVFEHMNDSQIENLENAFDAKALVVRIPCAEAGRHEFVLDVSKRDPTHINCKSKTRWQELISCLGYRIFLPLNLYTIYDSPGVMCYLCLKP